MNKELGRKITSLTLMTIMLTWTAAMGFSMTFMPEAEAANQYLWVSVEDAGGSKFYGGQVLEIVVTDPAINRLDEAYGMPDVTIDGKKVIMAQGVDGSWYAYIADGKKATTIDKNYAEVEDGRGADYGRWCCRHSSRVWTKRRFSRIIDSFRITWCCTSHQLSNFSYWYR